jgi:phosphoribosylaminoimidazolecarboxamide formyltransferase/IMP cyclohydrolase
MRYGENPHQSAAFYRTPEARPGVATARQVQGKQLSYNNNNDTDAAYECVAEFDPARTAAVVIVKHANPCGAAEAETLVEAYERALRCDPTSAFGGIVALNRPLDAEAARKIVEIFTEVIIAPEASEEAVRIVGAKKNLRLLLAGGLPDPRAPGLSIRTVSGGFLAQARDNAVVDDMELKVVTRRAPTNRELADLKFAFRVVKHVKSNAVVFAKGTRTVGIGGGQTARVDASWIACHKGKEQIRGSVMASEAFFPFRDSVDAAADKGVVAIVQPGGSIRDDEVVAAADERGLVMVMSGHRSFRH